MENDHHAAGQFFFVPKSMFENKSVFNDLGFNILRNLERIILYYALVQYLWSMKLWSRDGTGQDDSRRRWKDRREGWNIYVDVCK